MNGTRRPALRARTAATLLAAAAIPACRSLDALEPTCEDPVPAQVAKSLVWVPLLLVTTAASLVVESEAEEYVEEHGEFGRTYEHGEPLFLQNDQWGDPR